MVEVKPSHKSIKEYYTALQDFKKHGVKKETSIRNAFQELLTTYAKKQGWSFIEEYGVTLKNKNKGSVDGAVVNADSIVMGYWEAKDSSDDLKREVKNKFDKGYPQRNILFQEPLHALLYQDSTLVGEYDLTNEEELCRCLEDFFHYKQEEEANWNEIVENFKERIPESAKQLVEMIEEEKRSNTKFKHAFTDFAELCRASINPNLADAAIEEMLVQHLLTSRIFTTVFNNPEFVRRNVIAAEIEKVIDALTSRTFNRQQFFKPLDHFYRALEQRAETITEWSEKQAFLNAVYEKFFQGFAVKVADTHGIVYTPQPIVDFMVRSVNHILKEEFGRSLGDSGVHILDPFVGTGNFIMRIMREIPKTKLPKKFASELHCNEVMLLPYYIASMNIEHEYYTETGEYKPFEGICLVDTFELAEPEQQNFFVNANSERAIKQKETSITVVIGNPPYNAKQQNENDRNRNRQYKTLDSRVYEAYVKPSKATNKNALSDPYVKAFKWASDRIKNEGIVAFVSNNSFIHNIAFDAMRKNIESDFDSIYILDLGGNVRKNTKLSGTLHNVFGIQVGVAITILVKNKSKNDPFIKYCSVDEFWTAKQKFDFLSSYEDYAGLEAVLIDKGNPQKWVSDNSIQELGDLIPVISQESKASKKGVGAIFHQFSNGIQTNRDEWAYNFSRINLEGNMSSTIDYYNTLLSTFHREKRKKVDFNNIPIDDKRLKWTSKLEDCFKRGIEVQFEENKVLQSLYRPYSKQYLYRDKVFNHRLGLFGEDYRPVNNLVLTVSGIGSTKGFDALVSDSIPNVQLLQNDYCAPFYYSDGNITIENITDWALEEFRTKLGELTKKSKKKGEKPASELTKWDIFYYVYGILHHPEYRTKYAANLRRELPRIPVSPDFWAISEAGKKLADLHVNYESQKEYELDMDWRKGAGLNLRVEKMKLSKDKRDLIYNEDLTLRGIPPEVFDYKLGNRSALEWVIDQYQISTDKRSGITNNPNRENDPEYILRLIKQVITVSLETVEIVKEISALKLS